MGSDDRVWFVRFDRFPLLGLAGMAKLVRAAASSLPCGSRQEGKGKFSEREFECAGHYFRLGVFVHFDFPGRSYLAEEVTVRAEAYSVHRREGDDTLTKLAIYDVSGND